MSLISHCQQLNKYVFCILSICIGQAVHIAVENRRHTQPLLMNSEAKELDEDGEEDEKDDALEVSDRSEAHKPVTSIVLAYKLLTPSVKVRNLLLYNFMPLF